MLSLLIRNKSSKKILVNSNKGNIHIHENGRTNWIIKNSNKKCKRQITGERLSELIQNFRDSGSEIHQNLDKEHNNLHRRLSCGWFAVIFRPVLKRRSYEQIVWLLPIAQHDQKKSRTMYIARLFLLFGQYASCRTPAQNFHKKSDKQRWKKN